ncbi:hypothetical protein IQ26_06951 [Mesorhizobium tianshanense]|uniref:Uncharacterized protein n=1 Tax=Mesorhizobium tianshanense TaxID=39844 RepID=A0A562MLI3_9HYPH|nr:hypothetical protein IQ26_06951 [Mesorhizobium tianshanense]
MASMNGWPCPMPARKSYPTRTPTVLRRITRAILWHAPDSTKPIRPVPSAAERGRRLDPVSTSPSTSVIWLRAASAAHMDFAALPGITPVRKWLGVCYLNNVAVLAESLRISGAELRVPKFKAGSNRFECRSGQCRITTGYGTHGMSHDPKDDFDHPLKAVDDPLRRQVLYRITFLDWQRKR